MLSVWLTLLAGITLPALVLGARATLLARPHRARRAARLLPERPHGPGRWGVYVDTLPKALLAAAVFLVLFLLFNYVLVLTGRAHARVARSLLRAPADPLAEAKEVLARPGRWALLTRRPATAGHTDRAWAPPMRDQLTGGGHEHDRTSHHLRERP